jgi:hypothetical protein
MRAPSHAIDGYLQIDGRDRAIPLGRGGIETVTATYEAAKRASDATFAITDVDGRRHVIATDRFIRAYDRR